MKFSTTVAPLLVFATNASAKLFSRELFTKIRAAGVGTRKTMDEDPMVCGEEMGVLQEIVGDAPYPENPEDACEFKKNGKVAICDYNLVDSTEFEAACVDNGGKIITVKQEQCGGFGDDMPLDKLVINDLKLCVGTSCDEEVVMTMFEAHFEMSGMHCPKEDKNAKFILKFNEKKDKAVMRTCKSLAKANKKKRDRICFGKKFQVYNNGKLPASQVCEKTCKENPMDGICIKESKKAIFVAQNENGEEMSQTCGWLQTQDETTQMMVCYSGMMMMMMGFSFESEYGSAMDVCTSTCGKCQSMVV